MAVSWTDITNAQVAAGASLTTALMTALRDNVEGAVQRAAGAPKIFGVPYNYQEFTTNGTWTKPSNAETGDRVFIHVVGGGGGGTGGGGPRGGGGGGGVFACYAIDDLGATEAVVVGAGGLQTGSGTSNAGGLSSFGASGTKSFLQGDGGEGSVAGGVGGNTRTYTASSGAAGGIGNDVFRGGNGSNGTTDAQSSVFGGGGGGYLHGFGISAHAGRGGITGGGPGQFPGGGGGGNGASGGHGANGVVRVWCVKDGA